MMTAKLTNPTRTVRIAHVATRGRRVAGSPFSCFVASLISTTSFFFARRYYLFIADSKGRVGVCAYWYIPQMGEFCCYQG